MKLRTTMTMTWTSGKPADTDTTETFREQDFTIQDSSWFFRLAALTDTAVGGRRRHIASTPRDAFAAGYGVCDWT